MLSDKTNVAVEEKDDVSSQLEKLRIEIQKRLDVRTKHYLAKSNQFFIDYNKDWSVIWFLNKFIMGWKRGKSLPDYLLVELFEDTKNELFQDILMYRIICRRISELGGKVIQEKAMHNDYEGLDKQYEQFGEFVVDYGI